MVSVHNTGPVSAINTTMSVAKVLFCDICLVLLLGFTFIAANKSNLQRPGAKVNEKNESDDGPKGNCSCGGFPTPTPENGSQPLLSQSPGLVVKCDQDGSTNCMNLCVALATATKAKGPEILCNRLKDCDELKLSAFYKTCDNPWLFANMTAEQPLCCEKSKVKTCASAAAREIANTTLPHVDSMANIDAKTPL